MSHIGQAVAAVRPAKLINLLLACTADGAPTAGKVWRCECSDRLLLDLTHDARLDREQHRSGECFTRETTMIISCFLIVGALHISVCVFNVS